MLEKFKDADLPAGPFAEPITGYRVNPTRGKTHLREDCVPNTVACAVSAWDLPDDAWCTRCAPISQLPHQDYLTALNQALRLHIGAEKMAAWQGGPLYGLSMQALDMRPVGWWSWAKHQQAALAVRFADLPGPIQDWSRSHLLPLLARAEATMAAHTPLAAQPDWAHRIAAAAAIGHEDEHEMPSHVAEMLQTAALNPPGSRNSALARDRFGQGKVLLSVRNAVLDAWLSGRSDEEIIEAGTDAGVAVLDAESGPTDLAQVPLDRPAVARDGELVRDLLTRVWRDAAAADVRTAARRLLAMLQTYRTRAAAEEPVVVYLASRTIVEELGGPMQQAVLYSQPMTHCAATGLTAVVAAPSLVQYVGTKTRSYGIRHIKTDKLGVPAAGDTPLIYETALQILVEHGNGDPDNGQALTLARAVHA